MTYDDFKTYYTRGKWRTGDTDWDTDLPQLIRKAESRISRDLRRQDIMAATEIPVTEPEFSLPSDVREIASIRLKGDQYPQGQFLNLDKFRQIQQNSQNEGSYFKGKYFAQVGNKILMTGTVDASAPDTVLLDYYMGIEPYENDPAIPFYDIHPDFYEAAVNIQSYEYLKDYETASIYETTYSGLLEDMIREGEYKTHPAGQIASQPAGYVL